MIPHLSYGIVEFYLIFPKHICNTDIQCVHVLKISITLKYTEYTQ